MFFATFSCDTDHKEGNRAGRMLVKEYLELIYGDFESIPKALLDKDAYQCHRQGGNKTVHLNALGKLHSLVRHKQYIVVGIGCVL